MRLLSVFVIALGALGLAGCESVDSLPTRMKERFEAPQPQTRVYEADQQTVFAAVQKAMHTIDFQVSKAGAARGLVEAHSVLHSGESFGTARQFSLEIQLRDDESGKTRVEAILREQEESTSYAGATNVPIRQHGLYEAFFAALEQALKAQAAK